MWSGSPAKKTEAVLSSASLRYLVLLFSKTLLSIAISTPSIHSGITSYVDLIEYDRVVDIAECGTRSSSDETRITDYYRTVRYIEVDICTRCDQNIIADGHIAYDDGIGTDPYIVTYSRATLPLTSELGTDYNTRRYVDIIADHGLRVDDDTAEMREVKALTDLCVVRDLNMVAT